MSYTERERERGLPGKKCMQLEKMIEKEKIVRGMKPGPRKLSQTERHHSVYWWPRARQHSPHQTFTFHPPPWIKIFCFPLHHNYIYREFLKGLPESLHWLVDFRTHYVSVGGSLCRQGFPTLSYIACEPGYSIKMSVILKMTI